MTPPPGWAAKSSAGGTANPRARAASRTARASGCSERASAAAASASASASSNPGEATRSVNAGRPSVSVPVLSIATIRTPLSACSAAPRRNSTPSSAARPVPTRMETGVANPIAQGQAMMSTATAAVSAAATPPPASSQPAKVAAASAITAGTNHIVTRSTTAWIGSFAPWASSTIRAMRASTVPAPTAVARIRSAPVPFTVPPTTASPAALGTGIGSPVTIASATSERPSSTIASVGMRSPGRTTSTSPTASDADGTSSSAPPRSTRAVGGANSISRRMAADAWPRERASSQRPASIRATMTAAASKYTKRWPSGTRLGASRTTAE